MPREKKYTKTIAFRVTAEEWELLEFRRQQVNARSVGHVVRIELQELIHAARELQAGIRAREEARAKRAAKKAAANVNA